MTPYLDDGPNDWWTCAMYTGDADGCRHGELDDLTCCQNEECNTAHAAADHCPDHCPQADNAMDEMASAMHTIVAACSLIENIAQYERVGEGLGWYISALAATANIRDIIAQLDTEV